MRNLNLVGHSHQGSDSAISHVLFKHTRSTTPTIYDQLEGWHVVHYEDVIGPFF